MAKIVVLEPVAEPRPVVRELSKRPDTLAGKRVGFLSNTKPNADLLLQAIEARLRGRFRLAAAVHRGKPLAAGPAAESIIEELARECDVAVVAVGD